MTKRKLSDLLREESQQPASTAASSSSTAQTGRSQSGSTAATTATATHSTKSATTVTTESVTTGGPPASGGDESAETLSPVAPADGTIAALQQTIAQLQAELAAQQAAAQQAHQLASELARSRQQSAKLDEARKELLQRLEALQQENERLKTEASAVEPAPLVPQPVAGMHLYRHYGQRPIAMAGLPEQDGQDLVREVWLL